MKTVTFIGNGKMALRVAQSLKADYKIEVVGRDMQKLSEFEKQLNVKVEKSLLDGFEIEGKSLLLCVKPANVEEVSSMLKGEAQVIFSLLARTSLKKLHTHFKTKSVVRAMPILSPSVQRSMTIITGDKAFQNEAEKLLGYIGTTRWLESEKELDIATELAEDGPTYLSLIAKSLTDSAIQKGLKAKDATYIVRDFFGSFGELIQDIHPDLLKDAILSPRGPISAGFGSLEDAYVRPDYLNAVEKAYTGKWNS